MTPLPDMSWRSIAEPRPRVTDLPALATALIDTIQVAGDQADLEASHEDLKHDWGNPPHARFKMKIGETGEVFTVTVTRGWAG